MSLQHKPGTQFDVWNPQIYLIIQFCVDVTVLKLTHLTHYELTLISLYNTGGSVVWRCHMGATVCCFASQQAMLTHRTLNAPRASNAQPSTCGATNNPIHTLESYVFDGDAEVPHNYFCPSQTLPPNVHEDVLLLPPESLKRATTHNAKKSYPSEEKIPLRSSSNEVHRCAANPSKTSKELTSRFVPPVKSVFTRRASMPLSSQEFVHRDFPPLRWAIDSNLG